MCVCGSGCTSRTETDQGERMWSCERNWRMVSPRASRHADLTPVHETGRPEHEMGQVRPLPSSDSVDAKEPRRAGRQEKRSEGGQHNTRQATGGAERHRWGCGMGNRRWNRPDRNAWDKELRISDVPTDTGLQPARTRGPSSLSCRLRGTPARPAVVKARHEHRSWPRHRKSLSVVVVLCMPA